MESNKDKSPDGAAGSSEKTVAAPAESAVGGNSGQGQTSSAVSSADASTAAAKAAPGDSSAKFKSIELKFDFAVAHLMLSRSKQHNSMNSDFWREFPLALDAVESNPAARALIISADGSTFSSGMDLSVFKAPGKIDTSAPEKRERLRRVILHMQGIFSRLEKFRIPVIAAVQGPCIGAGLDLVCACDLRYATNNAYFSIHEINIGMMADLGTLQRLPKLLPDGVARELALTGDKLGATEAFRYGFVSKIFPYQAEMIIHAEEVAQKIAAHSPLAIQSTREALRYARSHSVDDSLEMAATLQAAILSESDLLASIAAQKSGAPAAYNNPDLSPIFI